MLCIQNVLFFLCSLATIIKIQLRSFSFPFYSFSFASKCLQLQVLAVVNIYFYHDFFIAAIASTAAHFGCITTVSIEMNLRVTHSISYNLHFCFILCSMFRVSECVRVYVCKSGASIASQLKSRAASSNQAFSQSVRKNEMEKRKEQSISTSVSMQI